MLFVGSLSGLVSSVWELIKESLVLPIDNIIVYMDNAIAEDSKSTHKQLLKQGS